MRKMNAVSNVALSLACSVLIVTVAYFITVWFAAYWGEVMLTDFSVPSALLFEGVFFVIFGFVVLLGTMAPFNYDHLKRVGWWGGIW